MAEIVDVLKSPFGLSGGRIFNAGESGSVDAFWYYAVTAVSASIKFSNLASGSGTSGTVSSSLSAGQSLYGNIYQVTQSVGTAIIYSGSYINSIRY